MLENNFENKFSRDECSHFNKVGRKIILIFFCFSCATHNKALGMMELVKNFFSSKNLWCKFQDNR